MTNLICRKRGVILSLYFFVCVFTQPVVAADELEISFSPASPVMHLKTTTQVDGTTVYDHSKFSTRLTNRYFKPIKIHSVNFISIGDVERSGLGDIAHYWPWKGERILNTRQSIEFEKTWGFTVDTPNSTMTYRFEVIYSVEGRKGSEKLVKDMVLVPN